MHKVLALLCIVPLLAGCQTTSEASSTTLVVASWYHHGTRTANGERFNPNGDTVAHRTLPFGTKLKLTNPENGKSIIVRVNDRGPFIKGTHIDVARGGAERLGFIRKGKTKLQMQVIR